MKKRVAMLWLRNDFRLWDNLALLEAGKFDEVIPVFACEDRRSGVWEQGSASKWWLHQTLENFNKKLEAMGSGIIFLPGDFEEKVSQIINAYNVECVLWNKSYDPREVKKEKKVNSALKNVNVEVKVFKGNLLCDSDVFLKKDGSPYLVFTPFWKNFVKKYKQQSVEKVQSIPPLPKNIQKINSKLSDFYLLPDLDWHKAFHDYWIVGEEEAIKKVKKFLNKNLKKYNSDRDKPAIEGTSKLSTHLHFGEISPSVIFSIIIKLFGQLENIKDENILQFCKEIIWREFSYHLLQHFPGSVNHPLKESFKKFPWKNNKKLFIAWTKGQTGYPIVDAGMRQLWKTGWMHNRVRMITASFLVKHLGIPWQEGAKWFWDTLLDADLASNTMGWQWVAGCGADAAPFFRIFNPITQGEKFDAKGEYASQWCPELARLPSKWIYRPWEAPELELKKANIVLGENYPRPIVDHKKARDKALWNYEYTKN